MVVIVVRASYSYPTAYITVVVGSFCVGTVGEDLSANVTVVVGVGICALGNNFSADVTLVVVLVIAA